MMILKPSHQPLVPLYMYARVVPVPELDDTMTYVIVSIVKGIDPDAHNSGAGLAWKDIYKIIKMPQFTYAVMILDITTPGDIEFVGKSEQYGTIDSRPVFNIAPGVDLLMVLSACMPFFPDGRPTKVMSGVEMAASLVLGI